MAISDKCTSVGLIDIGVRGLVQSSPALWQIQKGK